MATNLLSFRPAGHPICASLGHSKPDPNRRKNASSNWWSPLFGWSSEPDYIDPNDKADHAENPGTRSESDTEPKPVKSSRSNRGCFTEEKARKFRMMTKETETFHDVMYHSAIASRLASDFKSRSDSER